MPKSLDRKRRRIIHGNQRSIELVNPYESSASSGDETPSVSSESNSIEQEQVEDMNVSSSSWKKLSHSIGYTENNDNNDDNDVHYMQQLRGRVGSLCRKGLNSIDSRRVSKAEKKLLAPDAKKAYTQTKRGKHQ